MNQIETLYKNKEYEKWVVTTDIEKEMKQFVADNPHTD